MRRTRRALTALLLAGVALLALGGLLAEDGGIPRRASGSIVAPARERLDARRRVAAAEQRDTAAGRPDDRPSSDGAPPRAGGRSRGASVPDPLAERDASRGSTDRPAQVAESSLLWPVLDPPQAGPDRLTTRVTGRDPIGNRPLVLWRRDGARPEPLARTRSAPDGRFDFGDVPVPDAGLALVATVAGRDPRVASPVRADRSSLPPVSFTAVEHADGVEIRVHPARSGGEIRVLDRRGRVQRRLATDGSARSFRLDQSELAGGPTLQQIGPDGRSGPATPIRSEPLAP